MALALTNRNIRIRYLVEKAKAPRFSLARMGGMFMVTKQAAYAWTRPDLKGKMPRGIRAVQVKAWINDGSIEAFYRNRGVE